MGLQKPVLRSHHLDDDRIFYPLVYRLRFLANRFIPKLEFDVLKVNR